MISLLFLACPIEDISDFHCKGKVLADNYSKTPIPGIKVSVNHDNYRDYYELTDSKGEFDFFIKTEYKAKWGNYLELVFNFEDMTGFYKSKQITVKDGKTDDLLIYLKKND